MKPFQTALLALAPFVGRAPLAAAESPRVFPYVLKYAWFDSHPARHPDIHDAVVELEAPLSTTQRSVATIAYGYPKHRRISFQFAWERPPEVLEMIEGSNSRTYSVPLEVRRGIGSEFIDESASISVGSGGHSVDVNTGAAAQRLRVEKISPETYAENIEVGFREANKRTGVQEGAGKFQLSGAGSNYIQNGMLTADMRYAYIRICIQARGSYGNAFYVYENMEAGTGNETENSADVRVIGPDSSVEILSSPAPGETIVSIDFERGLAAPWGTGQFAAGKQVWWNSGNCDSAGTADGSYSHSGVRALHIINRTPRGPHVFGTTQLPLALETGKRYRITAWGMAKELKSNGGASIVVDSDWKSRPIQLPQGTYGWTRFAGSFVAGIGGAQLRILSEDSGEVWLDDIQVVED